METLHQVQRLLNNLRGTYSSRPARKAWPFQPGLPAGITVETLNNILLDRFDEKPVSFAYQHLSGWKSLGAFRLLAKTSRGKEIRLVYKAAFYHPDQIPALNDLPIHPGPPEYSVYSQPSGALTPYLPRVYLAEEITTGEYYRYLFEDLDQDHHGIANQKEYRKISSLLPRFHQALREWSTENHTELFLQYGKNFSCSLQYYAHEKLENYSKHSNDPITRSVLNDWPKIAELHLREEFTNLPSDHPIHGDTNFTNFHLHNREPFLFRLVDWEWAGFGLPHADLVSLLKGVSADFEKKAFQKYLCPPGNAHSDAPALPDRSFEENWRIYQWCKLERGLLDASFLAAQFLNSTHTAHFSLPNAITHSLRQVLDTYQQLSNG